MQYYMQYYYYKFYYLHNKLAIPLLLSIKA